MTPRPLTVAVVGATGVVGRTMIQVLRERAFPLGELRLLASGRSAGSTVSVAGTHPRRGRGAARGLRRRRHRPVLAPAGRLRDPRPGRPSRTGRPSSTTRAPGGWSPASRSSSARSTRTTAARHEGIIANPNCSTMQLAPVLMALRDAVGLERVIVDTYQCVSGHGRRGDRRARRASPRPRRRRGPDRLGLPAPDRVQRAARDRRLPRQRLHQGGVEGRHGEPQDPAPAGPADLVHGRSRAGLRRATPRRSTSRPAIRSRPSGRASLFAAVPGVVVQDDPGRPRLPTRDRRRRPRRDLRRAGPPATRPIADGRGLAFWVVSDNLRKGAATNAVEIAEILVRAAAGSGPRPPGPPSGARCRPTRSAAPRSRLSRPRSASCTRCRLHEQRARTVPGEGNPGHRGRVRRRGPGPRREPGRAGRSWARSGRLLTELIESVGWRRDDVFITNVVKCRPPGNRDPEPDEIAACAPFLRRQLEVLDPAVVVTAGPALDRRVHAR